MKNNGLIGIGCFAKPEILTRVLKRTLEKYILASFEGCATGCADPSRQPELKQLLGAIINGACANRQPFGRGCPESIEDMDITGFFLALENHELNLSVFKRNGGPGKKKYTAHLDTLTRLRQKRLH